jgi:hypothetical protein
MEVDETVNRMAIARSSCRQPDDGDGVPDAPIDDRVRRKAAVRPNHV